jgi:hypothetical protein
MHSIEKNQVIKITNYYFKVTVFHEGDTKTPF